MHHPAAGRELQPTRLRLASSSDANGYPPARRAAPCYTQILGRQPGSRNSAAEGCPVPERARRPAAGRAEGSCPRPTDRARSAVRARRPRARCRAAGESRRRAAPRTSEPRSRSRRRRGHKRHARARCRTRSCRSWAHWCTTHQDISGGDSSGGNIAALACPRLRDEGGPLPAAQVLAFPNTDLTQIGRASCRERV